MSKFVKVTGKLQYNHTPEPVILNIDQIIRINRSGNEYTFLLSSGSAVWLDPVNAQKVFIQIGLSL